jgi:hypothetical protein
MRKVTPFLSSVVIIAVLTLLQGLSDTGKEWAVMAMWFGLCNRFLSTPKMPPMLADRSESRRCLERAAHVYVTHAT